MTAIAYKYFDRNIGRTVGVTAAFLLMTAASMVIQNAMGRAEFIRRQCETNRRGLSKAAPGVPQ
jgi:hypothetical protein